MHRSWDDIEAAVEDLINAVSPPLPLTLETHVAARDIARDCRINFYDALIVASAWTEGCDVVMTEDLQHSRSIGPLRIVNPFA